MRRTQLDTSDGRSNSDEELVRAPYADFTTIDWVHDNIREIAAQKRRLSHSWRLFLYAAQSWAGVLITGCVVGLVASLVAICDEWLADFRTGRCMTGYYLNRRYCCWEANHTCEQWQPWGNHFLASAAAVQWLWQWLIYIGTGVVLAGTSAILVSDYAPFAAGSGIAEIKSILSGFIMRDVLSLKTMAIKAVAVVPAVASGLSIGKEGPMVHIACAIGDAVARLIPKFRDNEAKCRQLISAASAAGMSVAFGAPIGGVLFSLEEISYYFPPKTMWRSFFCASVAALMLRFVDPFRTGKLVPFHVTYDRKYHGFEMIFFVMLGLLGGLTGALLIRLNLALVKWRRDSGISRFILRNQVVALAAFTAAICFLNDFLRVDTVELVSNLLTECRAHHDRSSLGYVIETTGLCDHSHSLRNVGSLVVAGFLKVLFTAVTFGMVAIPGGVFMPSMAIGACFGRALGIVIQSWRAAYPNALIFSECTPDYPCVTPGVYALVGAAATFAGVTRASVSVVVIMFELTGALIYVLPIMVAVTASKWAADTLGGKEGIFEGLIRLHEYPYLDNRIAFEQVTDADAEQVMTKVHELTVITAGWAADSSETTLPTIADLRHLLESTDYDGFPVVDTATDQILLGFVTRSQLQAAIDHFSSTLPSNITAEFESARVLFDPEADYDFTPWMDQTPLTMSPETPMSLVLEACREIGLRYLLCAKHGRLCGLITKKDMLTHLEMQRTANPNQTQSFLQKQFDLVLQAS
ncbi:hypothetical protein GQ42DRAFT_148509 [Ramicandelaber brevisporus]|nr:hypothetical protein GQ42DRAFT_148509 [Ramicandelaber brevisporus]